MRSMYRLRWYLAYMKPITNVYRTSFWMDVAKKYQGHFIRKRLKNSEVLRLKLGAYECDIDVFREQDLQEYTRFMCTLGKNKGFFFEITTKGAERKLFSSHKTKNLVLPEFDAEYNYKTNDNKRLKSVLLFENFRDDFYLYEEIHLGLRTEQRFLGTFHPLGRNEIYFRIKGDIVKSEKIDAIICLMSKLIRALEAQKLISP